MQTLIVEVKDGFMIEFMKIIDTVKDNVTVKKDKNLEHDLYFYERQKELQQNRDDIKSGKSKTKKKKKFELEMDKFEIENHSILTMKILEI